MPSDKRGRGAFLSGVVEGEVSVSESDAHREMIASPEAASPVKPKRVSNALVFGLSGLLAGIAIWLVLHHSFPFVRLPSSMNDIMPWDMPRRVIAGRTAQRMNFENISKAFLVIGLTLGVSLSLAEGMLRPRRPFAAGAGILAAIVVGAAFGMVAGLAGQYTRIFMRPSMLKESIGDAIVAQVAAWGVVAFGAGIAASACSGKASQMLRTGAFGALGAFGAQLLTSPLIALLFPISSTDPLVPEDPASRFFWLCFSTTLIGMTIGATRSDIDQPELSALPQDSN